MVIAAASLLFPSDVIFARRRRTRRRRRRRRSSSSSPPTGRRSHQHLVGLVDVLIGLRDADDASHGGCRQRERPQREKCLSFSVKCLLLFYDVGIGFCSVVWRPFFCVWCGGKEGAHFKMTRCTLFKLFYTRPYLFFLIHHQSFNKKKWKKYPEENARTRRRGFKRTSKEHKMNALRSHLLQKVIKVYTYSLWTRVFLR